MSSLKFVMHSVLLATCLYAVVNAQGGSRTVDTLTIEELRQYPLDWGAWGRWSDDCEGPIRCGNVLRRRQRACFAYPPTGGAVGYRGQQLVVNVGDTGERSVQFRAPDGSLRNIEIIDEAGQRLAYIPTDLDGCGGDKVEEQPCGFAACVCWSAWSSYSTCVGTCGIGGGIQTRTRTCSSSCSPSDCQGLASEQVQCNLGACASWGQWQQWVGCTATCGKGRQSRRRVCTGIGSCPPGQTVQVKNCQELGPCVGTWSPWGVWSVCTAACGGGTQTRTRICATNNCVGGFPSETIPCNENACISYDAVIGEWGACSASCGSGFETRTVQCFGSDGSLASRDKCGILDASERRACSVPCYGRYSQWSACSENCGGGFRTRKQLCIENNVVVDDFRCGFEETTQTEPCNTFVCYYWGVWSRWSRCDASCGTGTTRRARQCFSYNRRTTGDTSLCGPEITEETQTCTAAQSCYVPTWTRWSSCSVSCGPGQQTRNLVCTDRRTRTSTGLENCGGPNEQVQNCFIENCYEYTDWTEYSVCTASCGSGRRSRRRTCVTVGGGPVAPTRGPNIFGSLFNFGGSFSRNRCADLGFGTDYEEQACPDLPPCYNWAVWASWGSCSASCGDGESVRTRQCLQNSVSAVESFNCEGSDTSRSICRGRPCYKYGGWDGWSDCSITCGVNGVRTRRRYCESTPGVRAQFQSYCSDEGVDIETIACDYVPPCYRLTNWNIWSRCTADCGGTGTQTRTRQCLENGIQTGAIPSPCNSDLVDIKSCPDNPCYTYSNWQVWEDCSANCGTNSFQIRRKRCQANGEEISDFSKCSFLGSNTERRQCQVPNCYDLQSWELWSGCVGDCGVGTRTRSRICLENSVPIQDGSRCGASSLIETESCKLVACASWQSWQSWTSCSETCGRGSMTRTRMCMTYNGLPANTDNACPGIGWDYNVCIGFPCPSLGEWTEWSSCDRSCGTAIRTRRKFCMAGDQMVDDSQCGNLGSFVETSDCALPPCYRYDVWDEWTDCDVPCGTGVQVRIRRCFANDKEIFSDTCGNLAGTRRQTKICNSDVPCYQWERWGEWDQCSKSCGAGTRSRSRACVYFDGSQAEFSRCDGLDDKDQFDFLPCNAGRCYSLGGWKEWSDCSVDCGVGFVTRRQICFADGEEIFENTCGQFTDIFERQECVRPDCYGWGEWGIWSECRSSVRGRDCGDGSSSRSRQCFSYTGEPADPRNCAADITDLADELRPCNLGKCYTIGQWGGWTGCLGTCGTGFRSRERGCFADGVATDNFDCLGIVDERGFRETLECELQSCYRWSEWEAWGECDEDCGGGTQIRSRQCWSYDNQAAEPQNCVGVDLFSDSPFDQRVCNVQTCYGILDWGEWSECFGECGQGTQVRRRACFGQGQQVDDSFCANLVVDGMGFEMNRPCPLRPCFELRRWTSWSGCFGDCGTGIRRRTRACYGISGDEVETFNCDNLLAADDFGYEQTEPCRLQPCYGILDWGEWSECFGECGQGTQVRRRACFGQGQQVDDSFCANLVVDGMGFEMNRPCPLRPCFELRRWTSWSGCFGDCGTGIRRRTRACYGISGDEVETFNCDNLLAADDFGYEQTESCRLQPCFQWSVWDEWSACSKSCGGGVSVRSRQCLAWNGQFAQFSDCSGPSSDSRSCNTDNCPIYTSWGEWSTCSKTCGFGERSSFRFCVTTGGANLDINNCNNLGSPSKIEPCNTQSCIGTWRAWASWSSCSAECGGGTQFRLRKCSNDNCLGGEKEELACNVADCITFEYTDWGEWSGCSRSCGNGTITRSRECRTSEGFETDPDRCGSDRLIDRVTCENKLCGFYGEWSAWGSCSVSCEGGIQFKTRTCPDGYICTGAKKEGRVCNEQNCDVFYTGTFTGWSRWGRCSKTCGRGTRIQTRQCFGGNRLCRADDGTSFRRVGACNTFTCDPLRCVVGFNDRIQCGNFGITNEECLDRGCCFDPNFPTPCYHARGYQVGGGGSGSVTITTGTATATGTFIINPDGTRTNIGNPVVTEIEETTIFRPGGNTETEGTVTVTQGGGATFDFTGARLFRGIGSPITFNSDAEMMALFQGKLSIDLATNVQSCEENACSEDDYEIFQIACGDNDSGIVADICALREMDMDSTPVTSGEPVLITKPCNC